MHGATAAPDSEEARIRFGAVTDGDHGTFTLENRSERAIGYWGYAPDAPQLWVERLGESGWETTGWDWCGTGLEQQVLAPGASVRFEFPFLNDARPLRLATHVFDPDLPESLEKIWSDPVSPAN